MLGLNRTGDYRNGFPITLPHDFGNDIIEPHTFGNVVNLPVDFGNLVTWEPSPAHFGNIISPGVLPIQTTPTFSPVAGAYGPSQNVTITSAGSTAIYYTLDGSTPTTGSTLYTGAITVSSSETIKALATAIGYNNSAVGTAVYVINGAVGTPAFSPVAGSYTGSQLVTISATNSTSIWYTTDGSTPTYPATGTTLQYTVPLVVNSTQTVQALGVAAGYSNSAVGSALYTVTPLGSNTIVRDNFVRSASASLGTNWTSESGAISVTNIGIQSSGVAAPNDNIGNATSFYNAHPFTQAQYAEVITDASASIEGVSLLAVSGDTWYRCIGTTLGAAIAKCTAGSYIPQVASDVLGGISSGSLIRAEAVPSGTSLIINMYVNGTLRLTYTDTTPFTSGSAGLGASLTTAAMGAWEGGNLIWTRQGTVIPTVVGGGTQESTVMYEGNSIILYPGSPSTKVFKIWYTSGWITPTPVINYAESTDGVTWATTKNSNPPTATDNFPGTSLSGNWTVGSGAFAVNANAVSTNNNLVVSSAWWNASSFTNDQYAQATVLSLAGDGGGPAVRLSGTSGYMAYFNVSGLYLIDVVTTSILATYAAPTVGQVVGISAVGTTITAYVNGVAVGHVTSSTYASGAAGLAGYDSVGYTSTYGSWSAGNGAMGIITTPNPVMANGATSVVHGSVFHFGSTYYAYESNGTTQLDLWTSPDGVNWTLANANVLHAGTTGAWDVGGPYNPWVWIQGGTWYMLYEGENVSGIYSIGLATSPDGIVWKKDPTNPVLTNGSGSVSGPTLYEFGGVYYLWTHTSVTSNIPTDISLYSSTDLHTWTPSPKNPIYERVLTDEGVNNGYGQLADPMPIEVAGTTYLYYDATSAQSAGYIHINMATMPYTMLQTVLMLMEANP